MKKLLLSIISGIILIFAFAPFGIGILAWAAFIFLFLALENTNPKRAFALGFAHGFAFFLGTVYWVVHSMYVYGGMSLFLSIAVMIFLVGCLALFPAVFALFFSFTEKISALARLFFIPCLWVGLEYLRGRFPLDGFPWALIGYSQIDYLQLVQIADVFGVWGVSFIVVLVNSAIYFAYRQEGERLSIIATVILVMVFAYGVLKTQYIPFSSYREIPVSIAQGNIEQNIKWDAGIAAKTVDVYRDLTDEAKKTRPEIIVWPETAMPMYLAYDKGFRPSIEDIARTSGAYLLTGALHYRQNSETLAYESLNSAFLFDRSGSIAARYDKIHLVPFGEYVPLKKPLFFVRKLTAAAGDFVPGEGAYPIFFDDQGIGILICYEAIFPEISAEFSRRGAAILVNLTNDGWFGSTSAPYQHLDMSRMRAIENRIFLVRAANTGISAIISPTGEVIKKSGIFTKEVISGTAGFAYNKNITTFAGRPNLFPFTCLVFSVSIIILNAVRRRRNE